VAVRLINLDLAIETTQTINIMVAYLIENSDYDGIHRTLSCVCTEHLIRGSDLHLGGLFRLPLDL
jgi:hypothetical protein